MPPFILPGGTVRLPEHVLSGGASNVSTRVAHSRGQRQQPAGRAPVHQSHKGDGQQQARRTSITQASAVAVDAEPRISSLLSLNIDGLDGQAAGFGLPSPAFLPPQFVPGAHSSILASPAALGPAYADAIAPFGQAGSIFNDLGSTGHHVTPSSATTSSGGSNSRSARPRVVTSARKAQSSSAASQTPAAGPSSRSGTPSPAGAPTAATATSAGAAAPTSSSTSSSGGLPPALQRLTDPSVPAQLPPASSLGPVTLDNRELDKLVATLGRSKATWRRALALYEWLQSIGHGMDDRLATSLIRVCAEHGQAESALGVYEWMHRPAAAGGGGLSPSVYTYTAAMRAALAAGMLQRALGVWEDARAAGVAPDCRLAITYIELCSRMGNADGALEMYGAMKAAPQGSRLAPTVHAYTAAMRAATEGGRWTKALEIWSDMRAAGVAPTGHAFAAAISACAAGPDWRRAVALFEEMCGDGIRPDVVSCTALVTALAAAGQWQRCEAVVRWMLEVGLKPNVRTFTALLTGLGNAQQWDRAVAMLGLMQTPEWGCVAPNAYTYSALLKALGEHGQWVLAERVFAELEAAAAAAGTAPAAPAAAGSSAAGTSSGGISPMVSGLGGSGTSASGSAFAAGVMGASSTSSSADARLQRSSTAPDGASLPAPGTPLHMASDMPLDSAWFSGGWQPAAGSNTVARPPSRNYSSSFARAGSAVPLLSSDALFAYEPTAAGASGSSADLWGLSQQWHNSINLASSAADAAAPLALGLPVPSTSSTSSHTVGSTSNNMSSSHTATSRSSNGSGIGISSSHRSSNGSSDGAAVLSSSWTSPAQLNGLDLELQHAAASSATASTSAGSPFTAASTTNAAAQQQQQLLEQQLPLAVNSDMLAGQLASLALSAQVAAALSRTNTLQAAAAATPSAAAPAPALPLLTPAAAAAAATAAAAGTPARAATPVPTATAATGDKSSGPAGRAPPLVNEVVCGALMMAYERAGKWQEAITTLQRARALGVAPNTVMYNIAISAAGKAGQLGLAEALFSGAASPDGVTYETLIAAYGMAGEAGRAEGAFAAMVAAGFRPRDYAYCGLIAAHSLAGDAAAALRVRTRMRRDNVPASIHVYNALIAACERAGQYERALELLRTLKREGLEPNAVTLQLMGSIGRKGARSVEEQQLTAAALSAAVAAAGTILMRTGVF